MSFFDRLVPGGRRERTIFVSALFAGAGMLFLDGASKIFFEKHLDLGQRICVIPGWFDLTLLHNTGAAWSLFSGYGWALLAVALVVGAAVIVNFRSLAENCPERYYALVLVLSGIVGNSIDRLWRGAVVDFLSFHYFNVYYYPVFNIADIAICAGTGIYLLSAIFRKSASGEKK